MFRKMLVSATNWCVMFLLNGLTTIAVKFENFVKRAKANAYRILEH
jgi:hypothetical protein